MDSTLSTQGPATGPDPGPYADVHPGPHAGAAPSTGRRLAAWVAALLLLVPTVVAACRLADTDATTPVPQLLAFLPWLLVPAGAALLFALLARWRTGMIWAAAVLAVTGWYVRPYDTGLAGDPPGPVISRIEVLTANVEFGNATEGLLAAIRREEPGLVFVQECARACSDGLAAKVPRSDYPYRNVVEGDWADGSAILSKYPLSDAAGVDATMAMPGSVATIAGRQVHLQLAHPMPPTPGQIPLWARELGKVRAFATAVKGSPALIAGDFNASQDHAAFRRLLDAGDLRDSATLVGASRTPTWPTSVRGPLGTQIDHVLISEDFSARTARVLELGNTDHRAVLVRLELHDVR